jgi:hypothetical protein
MVSQLAQLPGDEAVDRRRRETEFVLFTAVPGGLVSAVLHLVAFIGLGVYMLADTQWGANRISIVVVDGKDDAPEEFALEELAVELPPLAPEMPAEAAADKLWDDMLADSADKLVADLPTALFGTTENRSGAAARSSSGGGADQSGFQVGEDASGGLAYRADRRRMALSYGATPESENAVDLALEWLVRHQRSDGSWSFLHRKGAHRCQGCLCHNEGTAGADHAATALALLSLLGAGDTHLQGQYRDEIAAGLQFLVKRQESSGNLMDGSGNMYSHGLSTLALCEALAMARDDYLRPSPSDAVEANPDSGADSTSDEPFELPTDPQKWSGDLAEFAESQRRSRKSPPAPPKAANDLSQLSIAAQRAVRFIERAQHAGGGWRYQPKRPGDTSIVGWQLMALKSAHLAGLEVNAEVIQKTVGFLDSVSEDSIGSCYGYMNGRKVPYIEKNQPIGATTPIGLLSRMYTGWDRQQPGLVHGVERLNHWAQPGQGMYYYYYAAQVMHHYGGPDWEKWDHWMRNYLVKEQSRSGSEKGSWQLQGSFDSSGRLYCTALAVMTLEVYYRYSPIYGAEVLAATQ